MRAQLLLAVLLYSFNLAAQTAPTQKAPWDQVVPHEKMPELDSAKLMPSQTAAIRQLFKAEGAWDCEPDELDDLVRGLSLHSVPVAKGASVVLAEAGAGCARGGQGSNGAMWLLRLSDDGVTLIAGPKEFFNGWLYSIQPTESHGYRDIVLGWHMSASEYGLAYFRFDGKRYRSIGSATAKVDDDTDKTTITPNKN